MILNYLPQKQMCQLIGNRVDFENIRNHFSIFNEASKYSKSAWTPNRLYAITPTGFFRTGMIFDILKYAHSLGIQVNIPSQLNDYLKDNNISLQKFDKVQYYDYQEQCLSKLIRRNRGLCIVGTGGGKTLISAGLIESYYRQNKDNFRCLMLVDGINMVPQTLEKFKEYGCTFTYGPWDDKSQIKYHCTVVNNQLATSSRSTCDNTKALLKMFNGCNLFLFDEVHHVKTGNKICKFADALKCDHKYGFTGTMPQSIKDVWLVKGIFGDIVFEKPSIELRNEGKLTKTEVKVFNIHYNNPPNFKFTIDQDEHGNEYLKDATEVYDKEYDWLFENEWRNTFIKQVCKNFDKNILILVNSLKHLDRVFCAVKSLEDRKVYVIKGEVEKSQRSAIFREFEHNNNIICVAMSTIFSTGIDISNIHMVLFAAGGRSFIRTVQSIGRGIRLGENKDKLTVIDIADNLKYGSQHLEERLNIYRKEQFPYSVFNIKETT